MDEQIKQQIQERIEVCNRLITGLEIDMRIEQSRSMLCRAANAHRDVCVERRTLRWVLSLG